MSDRPTPETDAACWREGFGVNSECVHAEFARKLERERDEAKRKLNNLDVTEIHSCHNECQRPICVMRRERDEAREKIERQADRIRYLEGATNHAKGTPLSVAVRERDEARDIVEKLSKQGLDMMDENKSLKRERNQAREALNKILKNE